MAFDEELAQRIRLKLEPYSNDILEKRMFGGLSFLYKGKMSVGILKSELCVRYLEDKYPDLLNEPNVRPMDFTGKPMKEMAYISQDSFQNDEDLMKWIDMGIEHARSKL